MPTPIPIDPLFDDGPEAMVELAERFGRYRTYGQHERIEAIVLGPGDRMAVAEAVESDRDAQLEVGETQDVEAVWIHRAEERLSVQADAP